jgi:hypothetical protein
MYTSDLHLRGRLINRQLSDIAWNAMNGQQTIDRYFGTSHGQSKTTEAVLVIPNCEGIG